MQLFTKKTVPNLIGEQVTAWESAAEIVGWLDLSSGESKYTTYDAKMQESTHIFVSDYVDLPEGVTAETSCAVVDGECYDVMLIDNPMGMNLQLEIYLKFTGGQ